MVLVVDLSARTIPHHPSASCKPACFPIMKEPRQMLARRATMAQLTTNTTPCTTTITSSTIDPAATNSVARRRSTKANSTCAKATRSGSPPTMTPPALAAYTNLIPTRPSPLADYCAAANQQQRGIKLLLLRPRRASTGMLGVVTGGRIGSMSPQSDAAATEAASQAGMPSSSSITIAANGAAVGKNNFAHLTKEEKVERIIADPLQWYNLQQELRKSEKSFRYSSASSAANDDSDASGADGRTKLTTSMGVRHRLLTSSLLDERLYEMERLKIALRETEVEDGDGGGATSPDAGEQRGFMRKFASARRAGRRATMHF